MCTFEWNVALLIVLTVFGAMLTLTLSVFPNARRSLCSNAIRVCFTQSHVLTPVLSKNNACHTRYKLDVEMFKCWMRILRRVPKAVLWLLRFPAAGEANVLMEAAALGVDPRRVVFSDVADKTGHIRRGSLADMCLDTTLCR